MMNSARTKDNLDKVWLKANFVSRQGDKVVLRSSMFDGTLFEFTILEHQVECMGEGCPYLVEVGYVGDIGTAFSEIVLPVPALSFGHTVRVSPETILKRDMYFKFKELKKK